MRTVDDAYRLYTTTTPARREQVRWCVQGAAKVSPKIFFPVFSAIA